jgi:uncharacterized membrane protein YqaE (UPF0057 family)
MDIVMKVLDAVFFPILMPLKIIVDAVLKLVELVVLIVTMIPELLETALSIFNPVNILNEIIDGITLSIKLVVRSVGDLFKTKKTHDTGNDGGEGLFGFRKIRGTDGKILQAKERLNAEKQGKKCVPPTLFRLFVTVICPPLALLLHSGPRAWFHIIIASLLTVYCFYFPGLIYVVMHTMC